MSDHQKENVEIKLKQARLFIQEVSYVECPLCDFVNDLGPDNDFDERQELVCQDCLKPFLMLSGGAVDD